MAVIVDGNTVTLSGTVGDMGGWYWDEDPGITATAVAAALAQIGRGTDVVAIINSGGGIASEGAAIHAVLSAHKGKVTTRVQGVAASAASIIAMAGEQIEMCPGSHMMIHDPSGFTVGTADDHSKSQEMLNAIADSMASIYADKSGKSVADARADMKNEIWLTPEQAVEQGYATSVLPGTKKKNQPEPSAFNYGVYAHAPSSLTALARAHRWDRKSPTASHSPAPKDKTMTPEQQAEVDRQVKEQLATASAKAVSDYQATQAANVGMSSTDVAAVVQMCTEAGLTFMASDILKVPGMTTAKAQERVNAAKDIKSDVERAAKVNPSIDAAKMTADMIGQGKTTAEVKGILFDHLSSVTNKVETKPYVVPTTGAAAEGATTGAPTGAPADMKANMEKLVVASGAKPIAGT